jgi:hypothetical protein
VSIGCVSKVLIRWHAHLLPSDINSNSNSLTTHSTAPPLGTGTVRTLPVEVTAATEDTAQMANWRWPHKQSLMVTRTGWWDLTNAAADATATSAVPAQTLNARTSPRDVDAISYAPDSPSTAPSPGTVTVCTTADLGGTCSIANVWHKCSPNFKYNYIYSIAQELGAVCTYYRDGGCIAGNHVPSLRGDSRRGRFVWGDMKDWAGKVMSFRCDATG